MNVALETISTDLIRARMEKVLENKFDKREFRLSESGTCPRKRVARALGYDGEDFDETDAAYFERGNIVEDWVVGLYREAYPRRCRTQVEVRTPTGEVGHIDLWFPAEKRIVEIKSVSIGARELPRPEHIKQVQAYMHFFTDTRGCRRAEAAEIVYIKWGAGLDWQVFPVRYNPKIGQEIEEELRRLHEYRDRGELPYLPPTYRPENYPCSWRNRSGQVKCEFWNLCWANKETAPALDAPELAEEVKRYADLDQKLKTAKQLVEDLETALKTLRQRIGAIMTAHGTNALQAAGYTLKRTPVAGRTWYDIKAAIKANVVTEAQLEPFKKVSGGYERWTIKEVR